MVQAIGCYVVLLIVLLFILLSAVKVIKQDERAIVIRLGRVMPEARGPGLVIIIPVIDRLQRISLRENVLELKEQRLTTKDNKNLEVDALLTYRVTDPAKMVTISDDYTAAILSLAQTTLSSVMSQTTSDEVTKKRDTVNTRLKEAMQHQAGPWGIEVSSMELKYIDVKLI